MPEILELKEVFTPGGMPSVTYVDREHLRLEDKISKALIRGFAINVVTGPTKSGKSVLCHRVLDKMNLVTIEGGQVQSEAEFWLHIAHELQIAATRTTAIQKGDKQSVGGTAGWSWGAKLQGTTNLEKNFLNVETTTFSASLKLQCIDAMLEAGAALLVDDFHYIESKTQKAIIQGLKGPVMKGLTVFLLAVPHRAFDPMTVENEIEGRFTHLEIPEWSIPDLKRIPEAGFKALNVECDTDVSHRICEEAFGNPLLVQEACSEFCMQNKIFQQHDGSRPQWLNSFLLENAFSEIAQSKGFPKFQKLKKGPQARKARQPRSLKDGSQEDIYSAIMLAISRTGPKSITTYDEIRASMKEIWGDASLPAKNEITAALSHMTKIAREEIKGEPPLEWVRADNELVITDPFLLFYMKYAFLPKSMKPNNDLLRDLEI